MIINKMKLKRKIQAFLLVCLFLVSLINYSCDTYARDTYLSAYNQTVYNQNNGIGNNEVNCILQSSSGYIWIGTDGVLYGFSFVSSCYLSLYRIHVED